MKKTKIKRIYVFLAILICVIVTMSILIFIDDINDYRDYEVRGWYKLNNTVSEADIIDTTRYYIESSLSNFQPYVNNATNGTKDAMEQYDDNYELGVIFSSQEDNDSSYVVVVAKRDKAKMEGSVNTHIMKRLSKEDEWEEYVVNIDFFAEIVNEDTLNVYAKDIDSTDWCNFQVKSELGFDLYKFVNNIFKMQGTSMPYVCQAEGVDEITMSFGGNGEKMNKAISDFNSFETMIEAQEYIAKNFDWQLDNDAVSDFIQLLQRRYL